VTADMRPCNVHSLRRVRAVLVPNRDGEVASAFKESDLD
jgi:hypothetical protein